MHINCCASMVANICCEVQSYSHWPCRLCSLGVQHQTSSNIVIEVNILHRRKNALLRIEKYHIAFLRNVKIVQRYSGLVGSRSEEAAGSASAPLRPSVSVPPSTSVARLMPLERVTTTRPHKYIYALFWPDLSENKEPRKARFLDIKMTSLESLNI